MEIEYIYPPASINRALEINIPIENAEELEISLFSLAYMEK